MTVDDQPLVSVLYNADCPVCRLEIDHYSEYARSQSLAIRFDDLNDDLALRAWGLDAETAARRMHVVVNGTLLTGIPAFVALWQEMPRYRWLARVVTVPVMFTLANWCYDAVLAPLIYRLHLRRQKRSNT